MWNYLHSIHFPLSLSSLPYYQAEFKYIEKGLLLLQFASLGISGPDPFSRHAGKDLSPLSGFQPPGGFSSLATGEHDAASIEKKKAAQQAYQEELKKQVRFDAFAFTLYEWGPLAQGARDFDKVIELPHSWIFIYNLCGSQVLARGNCVAVALRRMIAKIRASFWLGSSLIKTDYTPLFVICLRGYLLKLFLTFRIWCVM